MTMVFSKRIGVFSVTLLWNLYAEVAVARRLSSRRLVAKQLCRSFRMPLTPD